MTRHHQEAEHEQERSSPPGGPKARVSDPLLDLQQRGGNQAVGKLLSARNHTGLPDALKASIEARSGVSLDDVRVHYRSKRPSELGALATAQGNEIHVAPGQERHLGHEAWHVVQQKQGRVPATGTVKGAPLNDDPALEREAEREGARSEDPRRHTSMPPAGAGAAAPGAPLQRAPTTAVAFLTKVRDEGEGGDWDDEQWPPAIDRVLADAEFINSVAASTFDDENEAHLRDLITRIKTVGGLSSHRRDFNLTAAAISWFANLTSLGGRWGFGSLDVTPGAYSGRPSFPKVTVTNMRQKGGQHLRHEFAWNKILRFADKAYEAQPRVVIAVIQHKISHTDAASSMAVDEAIGHAYSKARADGPLTDEEYLKIGLFVMNGNPRNLWAGAGSTNSALNNAAVHMRNALERAASLDDLENLAVAWGAAKGKVVYKTSTQLGSQVLGRAVTEEEERWSNDGRPGDQTPYVRRAKERVMDWALSNLELDVLGRTSEQTDVAMAKFSDLKSIEFLDNVVNGKVDLATLPPNFLATAIEDFMTYM